MKRGLRNANVWISKWFFLKVLHWILSKYQLLISKIYWCLKWKILTFDCAVLEKNRTLFSIHSQLTIFHCLKKNIQIWNKKQLLLICIFIDWWLLFLPFFEYVCFGWLKYCPHLRATPSIQMTESVDFLINTVFSHIVSSLE